MDTNYPRTKEDLLYVLNDFLEALTPQFDQEEKVLLPCITGTHYGYHVAGLEKVLRPFWGIVPAIGGGSTSPIISEYIQKAVTNLLRSLKKEDPLFLGSFGDYDQKFVEMCVVGLSLSMAPSIFWDSLKDQDKANMKAWLSEVNNYDYPANNWRFFRVFCNLGLLSCTEGGSQEQIEEDLDLLDTHYKGDGWYSDGSAPQYDYYISFAMHFYGLIYAQLQGESDPERAKRFRERAALFAKDFLLWFSDGGEALPFGRSLTYRFAQSSFWAAAAYVRLDKDIPWLDLGTIKGLLMRNLRWWFNQPIQDESGLLSIGYRYPNLIMTEGYNSPGSPYWAFKSFLVLALEDDHPFWSVDEKPYPTDTPNVSLQKHPRFLVCRKDQGDVTVLNGGQYAGFEPRHTEHKYAKLSYSTLFGFSVPTGNRKLSEQGGDNSLMIKTEEGLWIHRGKTQNHCFSECVISSDWVPKKGVFIRNILTWIEGWEVRLHLIHSDNPLEFTEGGSACPVDDNAQVLFGSPHKHGIEGKGLWSEISSFPTEFQDKKVEEQCAVIGMDVNTNLLYPRTNLPIIQRKQNAGTCLWGTISGGGRVASRHPAIQPVLLIEGEKATVQGGNCKREFPANWLTTPE